MTSDEKLPPYDKRRAALKGRVLMAASLIIEEGYAFETLDAECQALGLPDETLSLVVQEVAAELWRRALRLPGTAEAMRRD